MTPVIEDFRVPHAGWGEIFVRNVRPQGVERFSAERIVILQHGATYPSTAFDLRLGGRSWMDDLAARGFDAYCLDLPGYGRSTRPAAMDEPAERNSPFMRTPDAAAALGTVVDFVRRRRGVERVNLIGWSWGTAITASYTAANPDRVVRLALFAPVWHRNGVSATDPGGPLGAYRTVSRADALKRWLAGVPEDKKAGLIPKGWFEAWAEATFATDPKGGGATLRAPNGVVLDGREYWSVSRPLYDPSRITAPVLIVIGEWDADTPLYMAQALFPLFTNASWKRMTVLGEGTHSMLNERNRSLLISTVQQFLEEPQPAAAG